MTETQNNTETRKNEERSRYEVLVDGEAAGYIDYRLNGDSITAIHTRVGEEFQGMGLAGRLATELLEDARRTGRNVLPQCGYVASFIERNEEYLDLVPAERRSEFGL